MQVSWYPLVSCLLVIIFGLFFLFINRDNQSWETMNVADFNQKIEVAFLRNDMWVSNAEEIVERYTRQNQTDPLPSNLSVRINMTGDRHMRKIKIVEEGCNDDSIAAMQFELTLIKSEKNYWKIAEAKQNWKCQPGRGHSNFSAEKCF